MSERKVLNKYYPPDFDPSKIPRLHLPKDRQYTVRLMAPCNMRCKTCGEYIYKGKKFNARKETVQGEDYLGIKVFRFYIKCTRCLAEITFKTDPQNADYIVEHGATRNFQALKLAEEQAEREQKELEEEEANNPMKLLENRTKASKYEMEILEGLEELRDLNQRQANVDFDKLLLQNEELGKKIIAQQEEDDEAFIRSVFHREEGPVIKRLQDDGSDEDSNDVKEFSEPLFSNKKPTDLLLDIGCEILKPGEKRQKNNSELSLSSKKLRIASLVKIKKPDTKILSGSQQEKQTPVPEKTSTKNSTPVLNLTNYSDSESDNDD